MDIKKLQFFDKDGFNINFDWNKKSNCWEGNIYLPKVSVGLYANATIYILEETEEGEFSFPLSSMKGDSFTFSWDPLNKFVDEFFMFNFDETYIIQDTSALHYEPNDGPDCNTLIVNRFDEYYVELREKKETTPLPVHVAFSTKEKYDATTYRRTLLIKYDKQTVARITFYAETVEEDERLKIWNDNLGYHITPEDTIIFKKSDIKEYKPDYILLNEKRKELMLEGHEIYPYIGSYKAIINAIKFFGYDNLSIIEYWRNVNPSDENFGKIYHSSKYSLTKKETLRVGSRNISLPNKDYKKNNQLALVYSINKPTGEFDEWELPKVKEEFTYTIEEALIKLFALRKKLDKEFMPGTSRIIDIIGEANYFGIQGLRKTDMDFSIISSEAPIKPKFGVTPSKYIHITDNRYFYDYVVEKKSDEYYPEGFKSNQYTIINDILDVTIDKFNSLEKSNIVDNLTESEKVNLYRDFYNEVYVDFTRNLNDTDTDDDLIYKPSAKLILTNTTFDNKSFEECIHFGFEPESIQTFDGSDSDIIPDDYFEEFDPTVTFGDITFDNADTYGHTHIKWEVKMTNKTSESMVKIDESMGEDLSYFDDDILWMFGQDDEDLKKIGIKKSYFEGLTKNEIQQRLEWSYSKEGNLTEFGEVLVELPYVGYYDVILTIDGVSHTESKCIKVEPYNLEIKGFYYDANNLPKNIFYEKDDEIYDFILKKLQNMTAWAVPEHTVNDDINMTMPTYDVKGNLINMGPYTFDNTRNEWYLMDNITYDTSLLIPNVDSAKYIRNGVDVKPYTWFLLGYEYSKALGKTKSKWTLTNNSTGKSVEFEGMYFTYLLKDEGNYTVSLNLDDANGNKYDVSRNIIVVDKTANHKIYQTFKKEYDEYMEEQALRETKKLQIYIDGNPFLNSIYNEEA